MLAKLTLIVIVLVCFPMRAVATIEIVRDPSAWDNAPLQYSDIVACGTITAVRDTAVTSADFWNVPAGVHLPVSTTRLLSVSMYVEEVLRGGSRSGNWTFYVYNNTLDAYPVGENALVAATYHPRLQIYYHSHVYSIYAYKSGSWESLLTPRGKRTFRDADMRSIVLSMSIESVASAAEVIFVGAVDSVSQSRVKGPDGSTASQLTVWFNVEEVEKGRLPDGNARIVMLTDGLYFPAWRARVPRDFRRGQRWFCFVKMGELGLYPFAGVNGLLRVEGSTLIYDDRVPFWHSAAKVKAVIRAHSESGE